MHPAAAGRVPAATEPTVAAGAQQLPVRPDQRGLRAVRARLLARHAAGDHCIRFSRWALWPLHVLQVARGMHTATTAFLSVLLLCFGSCTQ